MHRLLLLALFALVAVLPTAHAEPDQPSAPDLDGQLAAIHQSARDAREKRKFARVEDLRLERFALLSAATSGDETIATNSPWVAGAKAIAEADSLIKTMQYEKACKVLLKAWQPFEKSSRGEPVFGDVAMKLFEATQAALAVYPAFPAVDAGALKKAVQLAADADPCAIEAKAADAFLTTPDPDEAFETAELRPSLKARNRLLLDISYDREKDERFLPWHAPTEYLKAQGSSFVLGDLGYGERFLGPRLLLHGRDGNDEPFTLVMGGALLITQGDADGAKRPIVADYSAKQRRWLRMRPRILRVEPDSYAPQPWQIDEAQLNAGLREAVEDAVAQRQRLICDRLVISADGLKAATKAKAHIRKILGWMSEPPKGQKPPTFEEAIQLVAQGYVNYARRFPEEQDEAKKAYQMVLDASKQWVDFRQISDGVLAAAGSGNAAGDAATKAAKLADFLSLVVEEDVAADAAADADASRLDARELRSQFAQQREHYETLALFKLMDSVHRPAIDVDKEPKADERLRDALEQYDAAIAKASGGQPRPEEDDQTARPLVITLDTLRQTAAALTEINAAMKGSATETERVAFFDRFARKLDELARTVSLEEAMVHVCTAENLDRDWKVGRTKWQVYNFAANTSQEQLAEMINGCPRLAFSLDALDRLVKDAGEDGVPSDARLPLLSGCTRVERNQLVENRSNQPMLRVPRGIAAPWTAVLLDVDSEAGADFAPTLVKGTDGEYLWLDDDGGRVRMSFDTKAGVEPSMVVRFAGADGYSPLGAASEVLNARRILKDRRGNTITLDKSGESSPTEAHYYAIRSPSGDPITERSVNYVVQDWLDLDRNIINSFLPDVILMAPSLPTWRLYRNEYARPAPRKDWKWTFPRRVFSLAAETTAETSDQSPAP